MPQTVRINATKPRREIKQLHAHGKHDPRHHQTRPRRPQPSRLAKRINAEPAPQDILHDARGDVGGHVVRVVPPHALEVADVAAVQQHAQHRPRAQQRLPPRAGPVEPEDADGRVVHAVEDVGARGEIVELLGEGKVARVEDGAQHPRGHAHVREHLVKGTQRVRGRDVRAHFGQASVVRPQVTEREEHAKRLLHAQEAVKGPLAVELHHALPCGDAPIRDDVLACVVAFARAVPEEEASV